MFIYRNIFIPLSLLRGEYVYLMPAWIVLFFFSVVMHEVAHGYAALKNGDSTAKMMGRLTLHPVPHIDLIGTVILPVMLILSGTGIIIGWAKPVPVNPYNFYNYKKGMIKVSSAGVLTNFAIAAILALAVYILHFIRLHNTAAGENIIVLFTALISINIILGIFNLIPVPPLDGSNLLSMILSDEAAMKYERIKPYGFFIIIGLLMFGVVGFIISLFGNLLYRILFIGFAF